jgi:hypothetical protein
MESTTINHPVIPIIEPSHHVNMFDISGNIIANLGNYNISNRHNHYVNSFNFSDNTSSVTQTNPATSTTVTEATTNTIRNVYSVNEQTNYDFETIEPINRLIDNDRIICNISQEDIVAGELYMSCNNCMNHFKKTDLMVWLSQNNHSRRTCPTCRIPWNNYAVYINTE